MQGLQIKYGEYSAHSQYLQQQNLLDEDQIYHHSPLDLQMEIDQLQFTQNQQNQQSHLQLISYREYLQGLITLDKTCKERKQSASSVIRALNYLFEDILLYDYHSNGQTYRKPLEFIKIYKWMLILRLFVFLILAIYLPQISLLSLGYLTYLINQQNEICSQITRSKQLTLSIGALTSQLKILYCDLRNREKRLAQKLGVNIDLFVRSIQKSFGKGESEKLSPVDRLYYMMFNLQQKLKKEKDSQLFVGEIKVVKRIYQLWELKKSNKEKEGIKRTIQTIMEIEDKYEKRIQIKTTKQYYRNPIIYFNQLFTQLSHTYSHYSNFTNLFKHRQNLINILKKQLQFKQIIHLKQSIKTDIYQQNLTPQIHISIDQQIFPIISNQKKYPNQYLVYQDDSIHNFVIKDHNQIKTKLQHILQKHEQQQRKAVQTLPPPKQQKIVISEKPQRSIFSFGIPFLPPARDMSAYYIQ